MHAIRASWCMANSIWSMRSVQFSTRESYLRALHVLPLVTESAVIYFLRHSISDVVAKSVRSKFSQDT